MIQQLKNTKDRRVSVLLSGLISAGIETVDLSNWARIRRYFSRKVTRILRVDGHRVQARKRICDRVFGAGDVLDLHRVLYQRGEPPGDSRRGLRFLRAQFLQRSMISAESGFRASRYTRKCFKAHMIAKHSRSNFK